MSDLDISYDAIIIGAGHNGLVAAAYLARARLKVLVLEALPDLGGMAATEELWPGYKVSRVAHVYSGLHPKIVRDLRLHRHGLKLSARRMATAALDDDGKAVFFDTGTGRAGGTRGLAAPDRAAYEAFHRNMAALADLAGALGGMPAGNAEEIEKALRQTLRRMDEEVASDLLRRASGSPGEWLRSLFESPLVQAALCMDALLGGSGGPFDGGQLGAWAWRLSGEVSGVRMALAHPEGGMGTVASALAKAVSEAGGSVRPATRVAHILVEEGTAYGIETAEGLRFGARAIVSAAAPRDTLLDLVGEEALDIDTAREVKQVAARGNVARLTLALSSKPVFKGLSDPAACDGRILIAPSLERLSDAWSAAKAGEPAMHPAFEITLPTAHDPQLAPDGQHILCANVLFVPHDVRGGWDNRKADYLVRLIEALDYYVPGIKDMVVHSDLLTPAEIAVRYGSAGGHWHHAAMSYDHLLGLRFGARASAWGPLPENLYFAGAGAHPGGGVTGVPGMLCAETLIGDLKGQ